MFFYGYVKVTSDRYFNLTGSILCSIKNSIK